MSLKFVPPKQEQTRKWLETLKRLSLEALLHEYGKRGVKALADSTPVRTSETANSWAYKVTRSGYYYKLFWYNTVMAGKVPLVILINYGHGTGTGGYVPANPFINSALKPVLNNFGKDLRKVVRR